MKKGRLKKGFTIIEVVLFLAISGAILAAIMSNAAYSVARRRYNDSVTSFVEEIRNAYSATVNVENYRKETQDASYFCSVSSAFLTGSLKANSPIEISVDKTDDNYPGRTKCAIYGQVITFGENGSSDIHRYDLIGIAVTGNIEPDDSDEVLSALKKVGANIVTMTQVPADAPNPPTVCKASLAGTSSYYRPQWTGQLENKHNRDIYRGAIMIARSPVSGTVHTYFYSESGDVADDSSALDETFYVDKWLNNNSGTMDCSTFAIYKDTFAAIDSYKWRKDKDLDICVGSEDLYALSDKRRAIRIHRDGSTESSVELLSETDSEAVCKL